MLTPSPLNLVAEIEPDRKADLLDLLAQIAHDPPNNPLVRFHEMKLIHFGRFVVLDEVEKEGEQVYPPYLVLSTNYDGTLDDHIAELLSQARQGLDRLFSCCKGYPASSGEMSDAQRKEFILQHSQYRAYFYRGTWGRTVKQIQTEEACRQLAEDHLDAMADKIGEQDSLIEDLRTHITSSESFEEFPPFQIPRIGWKHVIPLTLLVLAILALIVPFLVVLRVFEALDKQFEKKASRVAKTKELAEQEDFGIQNQLTHLVEVKHGLFRLYTLKFVLHGIDWLAKYFYNKGKLGGIPSIHFARWILIDEGKRLLFFSNFDGSWESYLGDFVDRAAVGLTAVWSNTIGFPFTRFLLLRGARDEQRFKAWTREKQIFTNVWYSAYPNLTVQNIDNNTAIHQGICEAPAVDQREEWLARY
ncbi:MAG: hypothetical protein AAF587_37260 [Bacteroidota bacterium]